MRITPSAFRDPNLSSYLIGNLISITGTWGQRVVMFWMAWDLTQSTAVLGMLAALDLIPSIIAAPIAGSFADRRPAFKLTRNVQLFSMVPPLVLLALMAFQAITLPALIAITLATGILNGLDHPLRLWLVGTVVPKSEVSKAVAANSIMFNIGRMIGPAAGGWTIAIDMPSLMFGWNAASFLVFAVVIMTLSRLTAITGREDANRSADARVGWSQAFKNLDPMVVLVFLIFAAVALLIRPVFELLPAFAENLEAGHVDAAQIFSFLTSAQGFGAMAGALVTSMLIARAATLPLVITTGALSAAGSVLFSSTGQFAIALCAVTIVSGAILANGIATQVLLQTRLPETVRGKGLSLYTMTFRGLPALGSLALGGAGSLVSLRAVSITLALVAIVLVIVLPMLWVSRRTIGFWDRDRSP